MWRILGAMNQILVAVAALWAACFGGGQPGVEKPGVYQAAPADQPAAEKFPYERCFTTDGLGRRITFYLSKRAEGEAGDAKLPLVLCVQGSGSQSVFLEAPTPEGKRIASGGPEAAVLSQFKGKVRVLVVEKPGVEFLVQPKQPGGAEEGSEEFRREHTLERWVEALNAGLRAAMTLPGVDGTRVLALGHSEGGQVVGHLAAVNASVTHVATLAGGGPTQLFDLIELARSGTFGLPQPTADERGAWLIDQWKQVLKDPDSADKFFLGHPHRRWTSFLRTSPIEGLVKSRARVFIAQGTADKAVRPASADVLYAELLARGRDVTYERVEGGDHGFMKDGSREGWTATHRKAVEWYLEREGGAAGG